MKEFKTKNSFPCTKICASKFSLSEVIILNAVNMVSLCGALIWSLCANCLGLWMISALMSYCRLFFNISINEFISNFTHKETSGLCGLRNTLWESGISNHLISSPSVTPFSPLTQPPGFPLLTIENMMSWLQYTRQFLGMIST